MALAIDAEILLSSGTNEFELIELFLDDNDGYRGYYGVNVAKVLEIIPLPEKIVKPPESADFVAGIFNHRGQVLVLVDLLRWLGGSRKQKGSSEVIITEFNKVTSAFLISGVSRIHRSSWENIKPVNSIMQNHCDAITGMILLEERIVLMLDLEKIISELDPSLAVPKLKEGTISISASEYASLAIKYPIKIIHADDSGIIRRTTKALLEENKEFTVTSLADGKLAWEYLESLKRKAAEDNLPVTDFIDVVLSDIEMPGMDGYHLCLRIKSDPELKALPVILFSSLITDKLIHKGDSVGADAQIAKPSPAQLVKDLKEIAAKMVARFRSKSSICA